MNTDIKLSIAPWKHDKQWAYSITYDEALADLARFVIPAHVELGIPGHVEVVAGQIGEIHNCGESSYNGMRHMSGDELKDLLATGWGVGCHSLTHGIVMDNPDRELRQSKQLIEEAIDSPVTVYVAPGNNDNLTEPVQKLLVEYGYLAGMSVTDDINRRDADDLLWINRVPIHERYWGVFDSAFDPFKRIHQAQKEGGWVVDYCHCPLEEPVHPYKDCSAEHHRERLETVASLGGSDCWYANPDDAVDYRYMKTRTAVEQAGSSSFIVRVEDVPASVKSRELTFVIDVAYSPEALSVTVDGNEVSLTTGRARKISFTVPVRDGASILVQPRRNKQ